MKPFVFREYHEETDLQILYEKICEWESKVTTHIVRGAGPVKSFEKVREFLQRHADDPNFQVVEDTNMNQVVGCMRFTGYNRAIKHRNIFLEFWGKEAQTEDLIRQILSMCFKGSPVRMVIMEIEGYRSQILAACRAIGFKESGCIEEHVVYGEKPDLWPLYTLTMTREGWEQIGQSLSETDKI